MTSAERVITKFGGQTKLADALGTSQPTVAYWAKTGNIPSKWHGDILEAAAARGYSLSAADLVNGPRSPTEDRVLPAALWPGELRLGEDMEPIGCYVLSTHERVISRTSAVSAIAGPSETGSRRGGDLKTYLRPLGPLFTLDIDDEMIEFELEGVTNKRALGITAETFLKICKAFMEARDAGVLTTDRQEEMAIRCGVFVSACATVGLIALIDEATGYQYERASDALQIKLRAFLEEEMRPWEKTFPDELWLEFGRLTGWQGQVHQRPKYWGRLVNELIYQYLDADVFEWLKANAPKPRHGQNYHQWLTSQYGLKKLVEHIWILVGVASACSNMTDLRYQMAKRFGKEPLQLLMFVDLPK